MADVNWFLEQDDDPNVEVIVANQGQPSRISSFSELSILDPYLLRGLHESLSLKRPDLMQSLYLGMTLQPPYMSLVAQARQSLRKITCYVISMLARVVPEDDDGPQVLFVIPDMTRAHEVLKVIETMGIFTNVTSVLIPVHYGGPEITSRIVIGTDLALSTAINRAQLITTGIRLIVFDETVSGLSCRLIMNDIERFNREENIQVIIFESSLFDTKRSHCLRCLGNREFNMLFVNPEERTILFSEHFKIRLPETSQKHNLVLKLLAARNQDINKIIIFANAERVKTIRDKIWKQGGSRHTAPELEQADADKMFFTFKMPTNEMKILISSSRQLDLRYLQSQVQMVINVDIPTFNQPGQTPILDYESFYRRTTCAGRNSNGIVFNIIQGDAEIKLMKTIQDEYFLRDIKELAWDNMDGLKEAVQKTFQMVQRVKL